MGYGVMPYCANWQSICDFYGSNDLQHMDTFLNSSAFKFSEKHLNEMIDAEQVDCSDYVRAIVTGKIEHFGSEDDGAIYHYVLEALCAFKGMRLNNSYWVPNEGLGELIDCLECEAPISELPLPYDCWPSFFAVPPEKHEKTIKNLKSIHPEYLENSNTILDRESVDQMISWFELSMKIPGNGVFMFQY